MSVEFGVGTYHAGDLRITRYTNGERAVVGRFCSIAPGVEIFCGGGHRTSLVSTWPFDPKLRGTSDADSRTYKHQERVTSIGHDVWIATGAVIMTGVHVGNGAVVGPYAVVFDDVPPYAVVRGNPARVHRSRFSPEIVEALEEIAWWDWPEEDVRARVEDFYGSVADFVRKYGQ